MSHKSKTLKRLRGMNGMELRGEENDLRQAIWKLQVQRATGQIAEAGKLTQARRDLARLLTLVRQNAAKA